MPPRLNRFRLPCEVPVQLEGVEGGVQGLQTSLIFLADFRRRQHPNVGRLRGAILPHRARPAAGLGRPLEEGRKGLSH